MKTVRVRYFATLREQAGRDRETVSTGAASLGDLYAELAARHGFGLGPSNIKASLNLEWVPLGHALSEGDEVVFMPPVAGG